MLKISRKLVQIKIGKAFKEKYGNDASPIIMVANGTVTKQDCKKLVDEVMSNLSGIEKEDES